MLDALLVHQAGGGIPKCQEAVIVRIHAVAISGERVDEKFQLVIGSLTDMDTYTPEAVLQMVRRLLQVHLLVAAYHQVIMGVNQLFAFSGHRLLHTLDVFHSHLIGGVRDARMAVLLFVQHSQFPFLIGNEYHLIIDDCLCFGYAVYHGNQVYRHTGIVHLDIGIGTDQSGQMGAVHIHKAIYLALMVAHPDAFFIQFEVTHGDILIRKVHGETTVHQLIGGSFVQKFRLHACVAQLILYLTDFHKEVLPFLIVEREQATLPGFLRDSEVRATIRILPSLEISEIGFRQKLFLLRIRKFEAVPCEDVLFVQGIPFT